MEHVILALSLLVCLPAHIYCDRQMKIEADESGMVNIWLLFWSIFYKIATTIVVARIIWKLFF